MDDAISMENPTTSPLAYFDMASSRRSLRVGIFEECMQSSKALVMSNGCGTRKVWTAPPRNSAGAFYISKIL